ncbi:MAG: ATP-binding protein [bacterium]
MSKSSEKAKHSFKDNMRSGITTFINRLRSTWLRLEQKFLNLPLKFKLSLAMLMIMILMVGLLSYLHYKSEDMLLRNIMDDTLELSSAIQIGVQQLTMGPGKTDQARLQSYINSLKEKGVKEISIVNNQNQIIASSNPKHKGKMLSIIHPKREFMITANLGEVHDTLPQKSYNIIVPIIVGNVQLGYAHIVMHLDDIQGILESTFYERILVAIAILSLGMIAIIYLSNRYTKPIYNVIDAERMVSEGNLSVRLAEDRNDEIGTLNKGFNNMIRSLSEKKELEKKLHKAEELSRLGQLSAGLAHEIKNPLNLINLSIDHLKTKIEVLDEKNREEFLNTMDTIKTELYRLNRLTEQFLNHGRAVVLNREIVNVNTLFKQLSELIKNKLDAQNISLELLLPDQPVHVLGEAEQLKTAFLNIILNAIDVMPYGGNLDIKVLVGTEECRISFHDTGPGIPEEIIDKIFEPFFSTKETGIGLGLAISKDVISQHNGSITVTTTRNKGTEFIVTLPLARSGVYNAA